MRRVRWCHKLRRVVCERRIVRIRLKKGRMEYRNARGNAGLFLLALVMIILFAQIKRSDAAEASDTISVGSSLTGNQTRISNNGVFRLGFFNLNQTNKWYFGIQYAQTREQTIVWVANREQPLENTAGAFRLKDDGNLVLSDASGSTVWSSVTNKASKVVIMDTGNLVVINTTGWVWESFNNPGNTWLPGMKISVRQKLISWKNDWDPSPGLFNLQMDPKGASQFVLMWNSSVQYWESGVWNGKLFVEVPEMTQNYIYNFSFHYGENMYFTYSVKPEFKYLSRFVMDKRGEIRQYTLLENGEWNMFWSQPRDQCAVYGLCGPYGSCNQNNLQFCSCIQGFNPKDRRTWDAQDWSSGCVRETPLQCDASNGTSSDGFLELTGTSLPAKAVTINGAGQTQKGCEAACRSNCSCAAYVYLTNGTSPSCEVWLGEMLNLRDSSNGDSLFVRLAASELRTSSNAVKSTGKKSAAGAIFGAVGGGAALLVIVFALLFWWRRRRLPRKSVDYVPATLTAFSYRELQTATKNFSNRLGGGGFGSVFKGTLPDNSLVAVKKLEGLSQGEKQFRMEVSTIGTIQHVNLVRLRGFCSEGSKRLLVYEYMPNGSLNSFLFGKGNSEHKVLDWKTRFGIALGTARGIVYLHEKCRDCIIHCDIKPENILLDANFCPKVADFGLAKLVGREFSHVLTTMRGTRGYLAPEWLSGLPITAKADVYSFGMTLLEIIAGRRNVDKGGESSRLFFPTWAATQISMGNTMEVVDPKLSSEEVDGEQVRRAAMVGGWCIQDDEDSRPSMSQVVQILEGIGDVGMPPIPMSLQALVEKGDGGDVVFYWSKETINRNTSDVNNV